MAPDSSTTGVFRFGDVFAFVTRHCCGLDGAAAAVADAVIASPLMIVQWPNAAAASSDGVLDAQCACG